MGSKQHASRAAIARHSLANPLILRRLQISVADGQLRVRARERAADRPAQLYQYLKEARETWGGVHMCEGAPLSPRESAVACALLSVCCSARRRTVLAKSFEFAHHPGRSRRLEIAIVTGMWGSLRAGFAVRSAGATRVRCAWASDSQRDR